MENRFYVELHKWCENIWLFVHCFFLFISHFHYINAAVELSKYNWKGTNKFLCCIAHFSKIKAINVSAAYFLFSSSTSDYIQFGFTFSRWHIESRQLIIWKYFERRNIINRWYSSLQMHQNTCMWTVNKLWTTPFNFIPRFTVSITCIWCVHLNGLTHLSRLSFAGGKSIDALKTISSAFFPLTT